INQIGLSKSNKSRTISNSHVGDVVFASENPEIISSYGDVLFRLDMQAMKQNGFMPYVSREPQIEDYYIRNQIARIVGMNDFHYDLDSGVHSDTVIIHGDIPSEYLSIMNIFETTETKRLDENITAKQY